MKDVGQIRALQRERFSGSWISVNHICVRVKTPGPSVSVNNIIFCTIDLLKFELCKDSVDKKAAIASDNKTSDFFCTINSLS